MAAAPLNVTAVAPVKFVPVMVTEVPTAPLVGVNELMAGGTMTVKLLTLDSVPPEVVTAIEPVLAPDGTVAVTCVPEFTV